MKVIGICMEEQKFQALGLEKLVNKRRCELKYIKLPSLKANGVPDNVDLVIHKSTDLLSDPQAYLPLNMDISCKPKFVDPFQYIVPILNRFQQYEVTSSCLLKGKMGNTAFVPSFCLFGEDMNKNQRAFELSGMKFPVLAKPLVAHGKHGAAHDMMLIFKDKDLSCVPIPSVLQNFENHDGFLLKAYVIGQHFHLVCRPSIRNLPDGDHEPISFCSHSVSKAGCRSNLNNDCDITTSMEPYHSAVAKTVECLRQHLHLDLFGVDLIVCSPSTSGDANRLAVIDVNIFPDYSCVPGFLFHLENLVRDKLDMPKLTCPDEMWP
uniref:Inositol-tetrakisphosphate 1-kinase n=4 Tax=Schistocephalus solidus TaxID=70667 RepID=A0A0V0J3A3_SCHSO